MYGFQRRAVLGPLIAVLVIGVIAAALVIWATAVPVECPDCLDCLEECF